MGYRRLLRVVRIARAIHDQLDVPEEDAIFLSAVVIGVERDGQLA